jgi:hypothetical protein
VTDLQVAHPDVPELAGHLAQHQSDAVHPSADVRRLVQFAWDALDDAVQGRMAREALHWALRAPADVVSGISAVRARANRRPAAGLKQERRMANSRLGALLDVLVRCKRDVAQSAEQ